MLSDRLSQYQIMWVLVFFDLPTNTKKERKAAARFRKDLIQDGFAMFQYSIYVRHCASRDNAEIHKRRVRNRLPENGYVAVMHITDRQFGEIELFQAGKTKQAPATPQQLELF